MKLNDGTPMQTHITGGEENDPNITEGQKKFIFSSTGNIMVATTEENQTTWTAMYVTCSTKCPCSSRP